MTEEDADYPPIWFTRALMCIIIGRLLCGCWSGTCPAPRDPEFVYVRASREPATCRAMSRFMRRLPVDPGGAASEKCAQDPSTFDWCMYVAEYNYAWELNLWISEVVDACREDGDGPGIDP